MEKETKEYLSDSWDKYFLKPGKEVYHISDVNNDDRIKLIVDRVLKSEIKNKDPKSSFNGSRTLGVKCHWFNKGDFRKEIFHTRELVPSDVIDSGLYKDWLDR